ncbi:HAD family hydrolase [Pseudactinotalea sp.]|uniref:HAD family hydrolase n=1 Tax=Pseudactinotalea sp. TaxID=1926260 RepID=UPI003B3A055E
MTGVSGVLFDVDDTLVDTATAFGAGLADAFGTVTELAPEQHADVVQIWRADAGGHFRRYVAGEVDLLTQRRARVLEITTHLRLPELDDEAFATFETAYQAAFAASWALFEDAHACVAAAVDAGLAVGVVTNAPGEQQRAKIAAVGLADLLPTLVAVDTLGVGKPDARVFREGCRLIGTSPEATLYVGDELEVDARGAVGAGLKGVWLDRPGRRRGGPHAVTDADIDAAQADGVEVIASLAELPALWQGRAPASE